MTKLLPLNSIVRVIPAHAYDEGAELNPGGLYMIREVDPEDDCLTYRLGPDSENSWASKHMIQPIDLKPGDLISAGSVRLKVAFVRTVFEDNDKDPIKIIAVNTTEGIQWITEGKTTLYGL